MPLEIYIRYEVEARLAETQGTYGTGGQDE